MQTAHDQVEALLDRLRERSGDPVVEKLSAQISVLCRGYMEPGAVNNSARQVLADVRAMANDLIWFQYGKGDGPVAHAYASATSTTVSGADVTAVYHAGRRVKAVGSSTGTIYGSVATSNFSTNTTVNYTWDSGSLANESLTIYLSQVPVTGQAIPSTAISGLVTTLPTRQVLTSGSSATYTTPAGCRQLRIRMVGGGGGGGGSGMGDGGNGGNGGDTIFNSVHAGGGNGSTGTANIGGTGGTSATGTAERRVKGQKGASSNLALSGTVAVGGTGGSNALGPGGTGVYSSTGVSADANTGGGGSGAGGGSASVVAGGGGGSGEYIEIHIDSPTASYSYTIGTGGTAGTGGTSGNAGGAGGTGLIIVDEYY